ncbi:MAG: glycosyltransferase [Candidatus Magasanikbacteria bacterium]|nr:glycosyltransferase [Candidatus Magasanikbacteria bacterium]
MNRHDGKFLLLTPEYPPDKGGVAEYLYSLVQHFPGEVRIVRGPFFWKWFWPQWLCGIFTAWRGVREERPHMVWISHVLPMGYIALVIKFLTGVPYVVFTHGLDVFLPQESKWKRWWMRYILKHTALVVVNSEFTASILRMHGVSEDCIHILYPGGQMFEDAVQSGRVSASAFIEKLRGKKIILSVGRLISRKGQLRALTALAPLLSGNPDAHYVIIGDGPEAEAITQLIKEKKLKSSVTLLRSVQNTELSLWYSTATLFLLPTVSHTPDVEGFGLVFVEAGLHGVPVIGGKGAGVDEVVNDGVNGLLIDGESEDAILGAVTRLLSDGALRRRLGEQGRTRAQTVFNVKENVARFAERIYAFLPPLPFHRSHEDIIRQALVSVIIPAYNHKKELLHTLDTLRAQTYGSLEIIVVDDGSKDDTQAALAEEHNNWQDRRSFKYIRTEHKGAPAARNAGIKNARGTLVIFWDADITAKPEMIEKMVYTLKENPSAAFVYSSFYFGWKKFLCGPFDAERLKQTNYITTTSLLRREFFPGFDQSLARFQDWDVWLTIAERGGTGVWIPEALFHITPRRGAAGMSAWLPSFAYTIPWLNKWKRVRDYKEARARVMAKHHLV